MGTATEYISAGELKINPLLHRLIQDEIAPDTGIEPDQVWRTLEQLVRVLGPRHLALLEKRNELQAKIDAWLKTHKGNADPEQTKAFLLDIGYLVPEGPDFEINPTNVDDEIATIAGPQLVVPIDNPRYALNAANARWGSLYDALYGTDLIPESSGSEQGQSYNPRRGELVIARANQFLDEALPLQSGHWQDVRQLKVEEGVFCCELASGATTGIADPGCFAGYVQKDDCYLSLLFRHHNLYIDMLIDPSSPIGKQHPAGVKDIVLEAAVSTIMDCEDSVAAVDAADKVVIYRHWAEIMRGRLVATFSKGGREQNRTLNPNRQYLDKTGKPFTLPGRSLLLIRHVGAHLYTKAVITSSGEAIPETFLDAVVTVLGGMHDLLGTGALKNSRAGSLYIVKPKQHGPEEVALSVELFSHLEQSFGLAPNTLKIGIMDEERRTTLNLKECIRAARERVIFINTGFLDRTGDEIHTAMEAGPVLPKHTIKSQPWILAYEDRNVDIGLACGFKGRAQIGKGMWPEPDAMAAMIENKIAHPRAGANCAWVPSPVAATLHALHYHQIQVSEQQDKLMRRDIADIRDILTLPLLGSVTLTPKAIQQELDNNIQSILGYVVRWIEQGIGCSKVLDIHDTGLMEDRATLRISSQHVANWLRHGIVNNQQVLETLQRMAQIVDRQNANESDYHPMAPNYENSLAFQAAADLIFKGKEEPNGYTEHILTKRRQQFKAALQAESSSGGK